MRTLKLIAFIIFLVSISFSSPAQSRRISNFQQLMESLRAGEPVRVVIEYGLCRWSNGENDPAPTPKAITGMNIDTWEFFPEGAVHNKQSFVVFSESKLIMNPKGKGFVINYGKVKISADNSVLITAKYLRPKNNSELMSEQFAGEINDGTNQGGISIFK